LSRGWLVEGPQPALTTTPLKGLTSQSQCSQSLMQTDPSWGWGMSIGLEQGIRLAELVHAHGTDGHALALAFDAAVAGWSAGYYRASRDLDRGRTGVWKGELSREAAFGLDGPLFAEGRAACAGPMVSWYPGKPDQGLKKQVKKIVKKPKRKTRH